LTLDGSIHIIVNNQLGFTTNANDGRSSRYSSDPGKIIEIPIIHVNAEEPDAVISAVRLAMDYRHRFKKDVIIDLIGYRRHGHNELDEPAFTQPIMYENIRNRQTIISTYTKQLLV
jgi:2-oxoglutarate dehydrogenase E1 component